MSDGEWIGMHLAALMYLGGVPTVFLLTRERGAGRLTAAVLAVAWPVAYTVGLAAQTIQEARR